MCASLANEKQYSNNNYKEYPKAVKHCSSNVISIPVDLSRYIYGKKILETLTFLIPQIMILCQFPKMNDILENEFFKGKNCYN